MASAFTSRFSSAASISSLMRIACSIADPNNFSAMQGGAYNEALKSFARAVWGLPEVRCVTYAALAEFMDQQSADTLAAYRQGEFARAVTPVLTGAEFAQGAHSANTK
jgi:hypothetical protein